MHPYRSVAQPAEYSVDLPITSSAYESLRLVRSVTSDRLHAYQLTVQALRKDDNKMAEQAGEELQRIDDRLYEWIKTRSAER